MADIQEHTPDAGTTQPHVYLYWLSLAHPFLENDEFFERMCQGASTAAVFHLNSFKDNPSQESSTDELISSINMSAFLYI